MSHTQAQPEAAKFISWRWWWWGAFLFWQKHDTMHPVGVEGGGTMPIPVQGVSLPCIDAAAFTSSDGSFAYSILFRCHTNTTVTVPAPSSGSYDCVQSR